MFYCYYCLHLELVQQHKIMSQAATLLTVDNEPSVLKLRKCDHTFTVDFNAISIEGGTSNHLETS